MVCLRQCRRHTGHRDLCPIVPTHLPPQPRWPRSVTQTQEHSSVRSGIFQEPVKSFFPRRRAFVVNRVSGEKAINVRRALERVIQISLEDKDEITDDFDSFSGGYSSV
jgi:hypothetical protein